MRKTKITFDGEIHIDLGEDYYLTTLDKCRYCGERDYIVHSSSVPADPGTVKILEHRIECTNCGTHASTHGEPDYKKVCQRWNTGKLVFMPWKEKEKSRDSFDKSLFHACPECEKRDKIQYKKIRRHQVVCCKRCLVYIKSTEYESMQNLAETWNLGTPDHDFHFDLKDWEK